MTFGTTTLGTTTLRPATFGAATLRPATLGTAVAAVMANATGSDPLFQFLELEVYVLHSLLLLLFLVFVFPTIAAQTCRENTPFNQKLVGLRFCFGSPAT